MSLFRPKEDTSAALARILAAAVVVFGGLGLAGWASGQRLLAALTTESIPMAPSTALGFLLLGAAVLVSATWPAHPRARRAVLGLACVVAASVVVIQLDATLGSGVLERSLYAGGESMAGVAVGRMSPLTALLLALAAIALAVLSLPGMSGRTRVRTVEVLATTVVAAAAVVALGYGLGAPLLYGSGVIPVAMSSAVAFIALGAALLASVASGATRPGPYVPATLVTVIGVALSVSAFVIVGARPTGSSGSWEAREILILGLLLTGLVSTYLVLVARHAGRLGLAVAELAASEAALRESEERYRNVFESAPAGIYRTTPDGRIVLANPALLTMLGFASLAELQSRNLEQWGFDPDHPRASFKALIDRDDTVQGYESVWVKADGGRFIGRETARAVRGGDGSVLFYEGVVEDITERVRARETMQRLATAVEQAGEAIVVTDTDGTIQYVNPAFERVSGYASAEVVGQNPRVLKSGRHDRRFYQELWETLTSGRVWSGRFVNRRKDGTFYEEEGTISPIRDEAGKVVSFVAVKRDISGELALREQLMQAQKMEAVGRLAGGVAHDFNNFLQAMLSQAQLLRALAGQPERVRATSLELEKQAIRAASLTRQLLLFSRRETAKPERLDLNEVIRDAIALLRRLVRENVAFEIELAGESLPVLADHGQLDQVLMNLVVNASDSMPEGGRLSLRAGRDGDSVWFAISDTGHGIPEEIRDRIFEPFFTTKSIGKGTGLGLSVVHGIVVRHGGRIAVDSASERGTVFTVTLPRAVSGELPAVEGDAKAEIGLPSGRGEHILVVEDEDMARHALSESLAMLGYRVTAVGSGEEAEALDVAAGFDLLLTDLLLPGIPGPELVRRLRRETPGLRVILMSGYTEDETVKAGVSEGTLRFLQKPFDIATLARELRAGFDAPA